tara:strand:+ start:582 stop:1289 length:708 start_codon:yes stop_codon:yes gene_type:complete
MALPIVNESSWYNLEVPSTKQEITYRPFLVKEQKVLLIASESQDKKQVMDAIVNTIGACVKEEIDFRRLPTFDIDYIFTQIRGKSVGESTEIIIKCDKCETPNDVSINITEAKIKGEMREKVVKLNDQISVEMTYPSYHTMASKLDSLESANSAAVFDMLTACIEYVMTEEEKIALRDESKEEVDKFIESLSTAQFEKISEFIREFPKLSLEANFKCKKCEHENNVVLEGLDDFF